MEPLLLCGNTVYGTTQRYRASARAAHADDDGPEDDDVGVCSVIGICVSSVMTLGTTAGLWLVLLS